MERILARPVLALAIAALALLVTYMYRKLHHMRLVAHAHLPQHPPSLFWGHLKVFDEFIKRGVTNRHPDIVLSEMNRALGDPPVMMLDNWPIFPKMVVVRSHEVARPSSHFPYSVLKSGSVKRIMTLIGDKSILFKQNEEWKDVRKRFNPGFAPKHLMTLLPVIVDKAGPFIKLLDKFARTRDVFSLDEITTNLTFDVIGVVTMGEDMEAQHMDPTRQGEMIRNFKAVIKTFADSKLQPPGWMTPFVHSKRRALGRRNTQLLEEIVRRSFESRKTAPGQLSEDKQTTHDESRSVLALSLQEVETLTPEIMEETCDQLKTFLFAGHDTTSTTIIWAIYELTRTPHALHRVCEELDSLFGPGDSGARDPDVVRRKLLEPGTGEDIVRRMTYIGAVMKEVLRLTPGTEFVVSTSQGDEYNLDDTWVYLDHYMIQRDRAVFGETADEFIPERWLHQEEERGPDGKGKESYGDWSGSGSTPSSAWRAFERGPRNCIGQELANIEARVILAFVVRRYDFTKVGLGELDLDKSGRPALDDQGRSYRVKSALYNLPVDLWMG
ncbi:cytochrome P450 [Apiospora saccharicola]|uniref:Cytochrome P450 n=1 Tax=Apiospora saccharicola TaxID=335842 RepID=A0ABR1U3R0_9PEZI